MEYLVPFAAGFETADGFPLLAGGLCPAGQQAFCLRHMFLLNRLSLGPSRDCMVIDVGLCQLLRQAAPPGIRFLAASVFVPGAPQLCGGVAGDILRCESSADGMFAVLSDNVSGFALPGACSMLIAGPEATARQLYRSAAHVFSRLPLCRTDIGAFLRGAAAFPCEFLFVSDGSGGSAGCMCTQTHGQQKALWLPTDQADTNFERGEEHD